MNAKLVFLDGSWAGQEVKLTRAGLSLGRGPDQDFVFEQGERVTSRRHARIRSEKGRWVISDEGSTTGTFINNRRTQEHELQDGDIIEFGLGGPSAKFVLVADPQKAAHLPTMPKLVKAGVREPGGGGWGQALAAGRRWSRRHVRSLVLGGLVIVLIAVIWWRVGQDAEDDQVRFQALETELRDEREFRQGITSQLQNLQRDYDTLLVGYDELQDRYSLLRQERSTARSASSPRPTPAAAATIDPARDWPTPSVQFETPAEPPVPEQSEMDRDPEMGVEPLRAGAGVLTELEITGIDIDARGRDRLVVRSRLRAQGGPPQWCVAARFTDSGGVPLRDENGLFVVDGAVASVGTLVPQDAPQTFELSLPMDELHLDAMAERAGLLRSLHRLRAVLQVWDTGCSARVIQEPPLAIAGPQEICLVRYLFGWGRCE